MVVENFTARAAEQQATPVGLVTFVGMADEWHNANPACAGGLVPGHFTQKAANCTVEITTNFAYIARMHEHIHGGYGVVE
jgi:hypothetical protein